MHNSIDLYEYVPSYCDYRMVWWQTETADVKTEIGIDFQVILQTEELLPFSQKPRSNAFLQKDHAIRISP